MLDGKSTKGEVAGVEKGLSSTLNLYPGEGRARARTLGPVEQGLGSNSQAQRPGRGVKGWAETRSEGGIWTLP